MKERLVGAAILVILAVILIPMLLTGSPEQAPITKTNIPEMEESEFSSKLVPIDLQVSPEGTFNADSKSGLDTKENVVKKPVVIEENSMEKQAESKQIKHPPKEGGSKSVGLSAWVVQLGSFNTKANADLLNQRLRKAGYPAFVEPIKQNGKTSYRVRVGPELLRSDADALLKKLKTTLKLDGIVLRYP